jgi:hypothetical protein
MAETVRLEEFTGVIQNKLVAVWSANDASVWLPTEFLLSQYITRILVVGRTAPASLTLAADASWTQVWRSPGAKEWSCLLGVLQHMPGPILIVVGPDIALTPKLVSALRSAGVTTVALRSPAGQWPAGAEQADQVFFPVLSATTGSLIPIVQEWTTKAAPRALDVKMLIPQLAAQEYGLTVAEGVWHWYKPADSAALVTLTVNQIAKQLQVIGSMLEKMCV